MNFERLLENPVGIGILLYGFVSFFFIDVSLPLGSLRGNHLGSLLISESKLLFSESELFFSLDIWRLSCMDLSPPSSLPLRPIESNRSFALLFILSGRLFA